MREFVGHGIGRGSTRTRRCRTIGTGDRGVRLREGMVLAIEPMVNAGGPEVYVQGRRLDRRDARRQLSAHFEHSVAVIADGPYILSLL